MKTLSTENIKDIKAEMKKIREALNRIEKAEAIQEKACSVRAYEAAGIEAGSACLQMMTALEQMVQLASVIGCMNGLYDVDTYHKIVKSSISEDIK